jgi:hypothetical protein
VGFFVRLDVNKASFGIPDCVEFLSRLAPKDRSFHEILLSENIGTLSIPILSENDEIVNRYRSLKENRRAVDFYGRRSYTGRGFFSLSTVLSAA